MATGADWGAIEIALHDEVETALGTTGARVVWDYQSGDRVENSTGTPFFASLRLDGMVPNWAPDYIVTNNASPPPGFEIKLAASAPTDATLTINIFSKTATGSNAARSLAEKVSQFFARESAIERLDQAGIAIIDRGPVLSVPTVLETKYESRASFTVRFSVRSGDEENTTYIQTVDWDVTYS